MKKIIKYFEHLLALIVGLGSFTACYGVPYTEYIIDGDVKDSESGEAIPGIKVVAQKHNEEGELQWQEDPVYTNESGVFIIDAIGVPDRITFEDVDGELNGEYAMTSLQLKSEPHGALNVKMHKEK